MSGVLPQVYLVRHGETAWTISRQHTGHTDIALTERGEREAQVLSARLKDVSFTKVLTSPLQRALRTGELAGFAKCAQADPTLWNGTTAFTKVAARQRFARRHLRRILASYVDYCHGARTHLSLNKDTPQGRPTHVPEQGRAIELSRVGGRHHQYVRMAA